MKNGGDTHEGIGQGDTKALGRGTLYGASAFPIAIRVRPPDARWGGVQHESRGFRFIQLNHQRTGNVPLHGVGYITIESSTGATHTATAAINALRATPHMHAGPITSTRIAGFPGQQFDATIVGSDLHGTCTGGHTCPAVVSLAPFLPNHHCGFCGDARYQHKETLDVKTAGKGQRFRIAAFDVRGKTVVVYIESTYADQPKFPPEQTFPTFLPYAQRLLSALHFPA